MSAREKRFCQTLASRVSISTAAAETILAAFRTDDDLMAEMMALSSRTVTPDHDGYFQFFPAQPHENISAYWGHDEPFVDGPWLPEPNDPLEQ